MNRRLCLVWIIGGALFGGAWGCNKAPERTMSGEVPVTGVVTLDGKPLAGAEVTFTCQATGGIFSGATDENGKYQLWSNLGGPTNIEGPCSVRISKMVLPAGVAPEPGMSPMMQGATESIPKRYLPGGGGELTADVPSGGGEFNFDLKSK